MKKILVELDVMQAACLAAMLIDPPMNFAMSAQYAATKATAIEGAELIERALQLWKSPEDIRSYSISTRNTLPSQAELSVDSGWDTSFNRNAVSLDFSTSRGRPVSLSVEDWRAFVTKVEQVITHCEKRLKEQESEMERARR